MIHTNRIVTVGEQESIIDRPIVLYRGDREVEIEFTLVGNEFTFSEEGNVIKSVNASHGQLVLNTPSGEHMFSELAECHEGKVVFVVTKEMIDEFIEMGFYSFQIRLYDSAEMKSRVTIPPVMNGFDIRNPIAAEDETNVVDQGIVDYARIFKDQSNEELPTFDWQGNYNKTEWAHHDVITENKMNKIEDALYSINANIKESDVVMLNALDNVKKDADAYVKEHMAEVEAEVDEFERNLNTDVQQFKIDTNAAMTAHKNEVSEELEGFSSQLEHIMNDKAYIEVTNFGAISDGVTDNSEIFQDLINLGYGLDLQGKTFLLNKAVSVNNNLRIRNGKIIGNVDSHGFVLKGGNLVELDNIDLSNTRYAIFFNQTEADKINVKINNSKFENNQYSITNFKISQTSTHYTFSITNSEFRKCKASDIYIAGAIVDYCNVSGCQFLDGYIEAVNFSVSRQLSGFYFFDNNKFFNYTNTLPGDDSDAHFIRCYGEKAIISNNIFQGLYLGEGALGNDTEALRPACNRIIIDSNIFIDAGYQEGFLSLKGCLDCTVTNNTFRVSDEYNEKANSFNNCTIGILLGEYKNIISNNRFVNFSGACIDTQDTQTAVSHIMDINDNIFENCMCNKYSTRAIIRITSTKSPNKNIYVRRNKVLNTTGTKTYLFLFVSNCDKIFLEDNHIYGVDRVLNTNNAGYVYLVNNHISDFGRIFDGCVCRNYVECTGNRYTNITTTFDILYLNRETLRWGIDKMILHDETFEFKNKPHSTRLIMLPGSTTDREQYLSYRMSIKDSKEVTNDETGEVTTEVSRVFIKAECWLNVATVKEHGAGNFLKSNNSAITNYANTSNIYTGAICSPKGLSGTNSIIITIDDLTIL